MNAEAAPAPVDTRYDPVAITLHWVTAISILLMLPLGFWMGEFPINIRFDAYAFHKSLGILVLALSIFRLIWRFMNPPPPLPAHMKSIEKLAANISHWLLYFLIVAMPLSGWLMVSASKKYPTIFFWMSEVPFIPMPEGIDPKTTATYFHNLHYYLGWGAIFLIGLHASAALKHHFIDKDFVLIRMLPKWLIRGRYAA